jgi:hypothetical protein
MIGQRLSLFRGHLRLRQIFNEFMRIKSKIGHRHKVRPAMGFVNILTISLIFLLGGCP